VLYKRNKERTLTQSQIDKRFGLSLVLPAIVIVIIIAVFPLCYALFLSFFKYELATSIPKKFVGLNNYIRVFSDARFWNALKVTAIIVAGGIILQLAIGLIVALLLNKEFHGKKIVTAFLLIPSVIAPVVVGFIFRMMFNDRYGPINYFLSLLHISPVSWLSKPIPSYFAVMLANAWEWFPFMMLMLLAGLQSISKDQMEAAELDGCNDLQKFFYVTLPNLWNIILTVVLIRAIEDFKMFDLIWVLTAGGPGVATETLNIYTYKQGFNFFSIGYALALAVVQTVLTFFIVKTMYTRIKKKN